MKKVFIFSILMVLLAGMLASCGTTPEPTEPPPTQTPWIIIATATAGASAGAEAQPTQTPWIIVATPTASGQTPSGGQATPGADTTAEPAGTPATAKPINTTSAEAFKYPPPALLEPPNGRPVGWKDTVTLEWTSAGDLAEDEYYHLHLDAFREVTGEHWYGDYVFTKETTYLLDQTILAPFHPSAEKGQAIVYWWVWVVRKTGEDEHGKPLGVDIGTPSEKRFFVTEAKPPDA
jgi:hypothetical protein